MPNKITQYRPGFFSGFKNSIVEFETTEELLNIDFVKKFSKFPNGENDKKFYRYSINEVNGHNQKFLMAEYDNGYKWWVIGLINESAKVDLPEWKPKDKNKRE